MSSPSRPRLDLPFEPGHEVVGQLHPFEGLAKHELARMQDEGLLVGDRQQLGQVGLRLADIDEGIAVVAEHAELPVQVQVDRRRLEAVGVIRVDAHPTGFHGGADITVREDAHRRRGRRGVTPAGRAARESRLGDGATSSSETWPGTSGDRSANRVSTSRLSCSRSSNDW